MIGDESPVSVEDPVGAPRVRLGRWIALLAVAVLLFSATTFAAVSASSSRSNAIGQRDRSRASVAQERRATRAARDARDATLSDARALRLALADPLASVAALVQLSGQGVAAVQDAQRSGPETSFEAVETYNEAVARANTVAEQFDAALDRLTQQIGTLVGQQVRSV